MFYCNICETVFDECKTVEEHHPYGMSYATEYFAVCPHCGDTDFVEAKKCERCGEYFGELEDGLCDVCHGDMYG